MASLFLWLSFLIFCTTKSIDECSDGSHDCDDNASCLNYPREGYMCSCNDNWYGNGYNCYQCTYIDMDNCDENAYCDDEMGGFCQCNDFYSGNGTSCGLEEEIVEDIENGIYCGYSDDSKWEVWDYGFNIWSSISDECILRYSRINNPSSIDKKWIDPSKPILMISHDRWASYGSLIEHYIGDKWTDWAGGVCVDGANDDDEEDEECLPTDHDVRYWMQEGWNVIFIDWKYYANDEGQPPYAAEENLYDHVHENLSVTDLIYERLISLLNLVEWNGDELRLSGNSLGAQLVLRLAARLKTDDSNNYGDSIKRIALLDPYYTAFGKSFLPFRYSWCKWSWCEHIWVGENIRDYLMKDIRGDIDTAPVIENYRTSDLYLVGDYNIPFNKMTVFVNMHLYFYDMWALGSKHIAAIPMYTHCMKWKVKYNYGKNQDGAPSCRMSTADIKSQCIISSWNDRCQSEYSQYDGSYTTWDYDDRFHHSSIQHVNLYDNDYYYKNIDDVLLYIIGIILLVNLICCIFYVQSVKCKNIKKSKYNYKVVSIQDSSEEI